MTEISNTERVMLNALSVALEELGKYITEKAGPSILTGYMSAAAADASKELDKYLEDGNMDHLRKAHAILEQGVGFRK